LRVMYSSYVIHPFAETVFLYNVCPFFVLCFFFFLDKNRSQKACIMFMTLVPAGVTLQVSFVYLAERKAKLNYGFIRGGCAR
jgi:hypothetical protein